MNSIDRLLAAASGAGEFDVSDVDESVLLLLIEQAVDGPAAIDVFFWLSARCDESAALNGAAHLLKCTRDPAVLAEILDVLSGGWELSDEAARVFWNVFVLRMEDRHASYGVRSQSLHGALLLSQSRPALLRRLEGALLDIDVTDDPHFLRHGAKVIGAVLAHDPAEVFREKLKTMFVVDEAQDEVAMELGLDALRCGLESTSHTVALATFKVAVGWFDCAMKASEQRIDAELFRRCGEMLVMVQDRGFDGALAEHIKGLQAAAFRYSAFLLPSDRGTGDLSWVGSSISERIHWTMLGLRLGALDISLKKRIWTDVGRVVEDELMAIYRASRSFFLRGGEGGLEQILRPRISDALSIHRRHLEELAQWIDENAQSPSLPDANAMREAVDESLERSVLRTPSDAVSDDRALTAILDAGQVSGEDRPALYERLRKSIWMLKLDDNPITTRLEAGIIAALSESNEHYRSVSEARVLFDAILHYSLSFLVFRHNTGRATDPTASYLFVRQPAALPLESDLHQDYYKFLAGTLLRDAVQMEVRDVGSGRADIYFAYRGITTVTEVKRSDRDCDHSELLNAFGGQTSAYQSTNVTFGFLLVLDLLDRGGGQPHIEEQISLKRKKPLGQSTEYDIVVMRVQGQRVTPSSQH